jgi:hypothetical protein
VTTLRGGVVRSLITNKRFENNKVVVIENDNHLKGQDYRKGLDYFSN